jgi:hypothetical protein
MRCPCCGGTQTQRLEVIYAGGVTEVSATSRVHGLAIHPAVVQTQQLEQTLLARSIEPPRRHNAATAGWCLVIGAIVLYLAFSAKRFGLTEWFELAVGAASLGLGYLLAHHFGRLNKEVAKEYELWQQTWYCHQCGTLLR